MVLFVGDSFGDVSSTGVVYLSMSRNQGSFVGLCSDLLVCVVCSVSVGDPFFLIF